MRKKLEIFNERKNYLPLRKVGKTFIKDIVCLKERMRRGCYKRNMIQLNKRALCNVVPPFVLIKRL